MAVIPQAKIYNSNGVDLIYNIGYMLKDYTTGWPDDENPNQVALTNLRSQGEIVIPAGSLASEIVIAGRLTASDYDNLIAAYNTLKSTIVANTRYYLKIDLTGATTDDIKVIRKRKIEIIRTNWRNWLWYSVPLTKNAWA